MEDPTAEEGEGELWAMQLEDGEADENIYYDVAAVRQRVASGSSAGRQLDLFGACREGDLERAKYLVEVEEVNVNMKDAFDALPIYFCCLCGHQDVLEYLLDHGARLDDGTFEAHRCYYASLTEGIQKVLREAKAKPNLGAMDFFAEHLRRLCPASFSRDVEGAAVLQGGDLCSDFVLEMPAPRPSLPVHRCVLAARCAYFERLLSRQWRRRRKKLLPRCTGPRGDAFAVVLEYIYTDSANFELTIADDVLRLAEQCGLERLASEVEKELKLVMLHLRQLQGRASQISRVMVKPGGATTGSDLRADIGKLLPPLEPEPELAELPLSARFSDVVFDVQGSSGSAQSFACHRGILAARSEYFRTLFAGARDWANGGRISVALQPWVFHSLLQHIYTDGLPHTVPGPPETAELCAAVPPLGVLHRCLRQGAETESQAKDLLQQLRADGLAVPAEEIGRAVESSGVVEGLSDAEAALCEVVEVTAMVLDAATMYLDVELRSLCVATLVRCIRPCTATRCVELGMLFSSAKLLDAATDFVVDGLLLVALPRRAACIAAACIAGAQARAEAEGLTVDSVQQLPLDFAPLEACVPPHTGGPAEGEWSPHCGVDLRPEFRSWLDLASNHEMALHLVREIIERCKCSRSLCVSVRRSSKKAAAQTPHNTSKTCSARRRARCARRPGSPTRRSCSEAWRRRSAAPGRRARATASGAAWRRERPRRMRCRSPGWWRAWLSNCLPGDEFSERNGTWLPDATVMEFPNCLYCILTHTSQTYRGRYPSTMKSCVSWYGRDSSCGPPPPTAASTSLRKTSSSGTCAKRSGN